MLLAGSTRYPTQEHRVQNDTGETGLTPPPTRTNLIAAYCSADKTLRFGSRSRLVGGRETTRPPQRQPSNRRLWKSFPVHAGSFSSKALDSFQPTRAHDRITANKACTRRSNLLYSLGSYSTRNPVSRGQTNFPGCLNQLHVFRLHFFDSCPSP